MPQKLLLSVAGARGIVGQGIDEDVVRRLTRAFCATLPDGAIVVGRDTRPSGASFMDAAMVAITTSGRDCVDLGIATTPTVEMVTEKLAAAGGIIVTASHNPVEWNALKFLNGRGIFITKPISEKLYAAYAAGTSHADAAVQGKVLTHPSAAREHIDAILALDVVDVDAIRARRFNVVIDCINGAGSVIVPTLLDQLGVNVVAINSTPNGDFYRDPEPRPDNLRDLADRVRSEGADVGFACDPDADRLALVTQRGEAVSEEYTLALACDHVLSQTSGDIVVNVSTSSAIDTVAARYGVRVFRTPVGEAHVVDRMLAEGAVIGGEGNGGVIYPALHPGRDAVLGVALVLQFLASRTGTLSDHLADYPPFVMTKEKEPLAGVFSTERFAARARELEPVAIDTQDGVKATFSDGWFHVRVSNTEGVVRVIAEATSEEISRMYQEKARVALAASW